MEFAHERRVYTHVFVSDLDAMLRVLLDGGSRLFLQQRGCHPQKRGGVRANLKNQPQISL